MDFKNRTFLASVATTIGVLMVAALGIVALRAQQGPPPGRGPGGRGQGMFGLGPGGRGPMAGMVMRGLGQLNLTDAQKGQIKTILEGHKADTQDIAKRMIAAREALGDLVTSGASDEASIRTAAGVVGGVEADAAVLRAKVHTEVFAVLTADQQAKAKELRANAKARIGQMIGRGMGRGMGQGMGRGMGRGMGLGTGRGIGRGGRGPGGPGGFGGRLDREGFGADF